MDVPRLNERRWVAGIILLYALFAVAYSVLMPIWEAPDEPAHYHLAWRLARFGPFPTLRENYEADQPRAYYYLGSLVIRGLDRINPRLSDYYLPHEYTTSMLIPVRRFDWNQSNYRFLLGVYVLRWINIAFGACALWLAWRAFLIVAPGMLTLRLAALALAAFTPQYLHIMSSVSNDPLGALAGALLFYLAVRMASTGPGRLYWVSIPLAIILPLMTKLTVLPVSLALLLTAGWQMIRSPKHRKQLAILGLTAAGVLLIVFAISPVILRTAEYEISWRLLNFRPDASSPKYIVYISKQIIWTYWGRLGWMAIALPAPILAGLCGFGLIGMMISAWKLIRARSNFPQFGAWAVTWLTSILTAGAVMKNGLITSASQGRFLFPAIGALSLLMVSGWHAIVPAPYQRWLPLIVINLMLLCTLILWQFGVLPVYFQPFMDR